MLRREGDESVVLQARGREWKVVYRGDHDAARAVAEDLEEELRLWPEEER
jgi:hypothetical protein